MLDELKILINAIEEQYEHLYFEWKKSSLYVPINQKKF